ncbi:hypothetical protein [Providencia stuartii]|uniref:hypothetical protein n=1 Tax=Providencia stuartii TaxID=588 RepID=UPI00198020F6|nr:hypothetical protein [Providencia stuartii]MBN4863823.1 hypothetical protein [Providencia stuartii]MBN4873145.1 hypothetical protein [Providencia stuartii]MBN4877734.1 hypothetical protein [Providencia stuartii]MBN4882346.1 hypothetical protein [Providencia stuartii]
MDWKEKVSTGFGDQDCVFAQHSIDIERAKNVIKEAKSAGATFQDFEKEIVWHIYNKVKGPHQKEFIETQVKRAKNLW